MLQAKPATPEAHFLSPSEEETLVRYYMKKLLELCTQFHPPVPRSTIVSVCMGGGEGAERHIRSLHPFTVLCLQATAANYLKRYYLTTSVMDYHPRDI